MMYDNIGLKEGQDVSIIEVGKHLFFRTDNPSFGGQNGFQHQVHPLLSPQKVQCLHRSVYLGHKRPN